MDGHIEMPFKPELYDEVMMHFQDHASPAKSDASSVDIYDDLDMVTSTEQAAEKSSPSRNCLDLYEEILTEEGTAKEASFNDLQGEYEKCQNQMKQLITKLKEMQSMNSSLQNENQCLKKNISALIKTARVEITRKEDEINRLNERFGAPWRKPNPLPLLSINKSKSNNNDLAKNLKTESLQKRPIDLPSKDITQTSRVATCNKEKTCIESSQTMTSLNPTAKQCKGSTVYRSQEQTLEPLCLELNDKYRKEKSMDSQNKDPERNRTKERPKSSLASSVGEGSDLKEKACQPLLKCGKNESSQENRNSKPEVGSETKNHKYHSSSTKEKMQLKELDYSKEKQVKKIERSPHRRESRAQEKEKNTESRHRTPEENEEPRRSKRTQKDDASHKVLELSDAKKSDAGRKDKRSSEYSVSKHGNKDSKQSKCENSTRSKPNREHKTERSDRDKKGDEKKRSRDEQDRSRPDRKDKGHQTKEKDMHQSSSKDKGLHSKISEKSKNCEKAKVEDNIQKDLKLSFMETLHLTLSPAKKSSAVTEQVVSSMESEVEGNMAKGASQLSVIENNAAPLHPQKTDLRHGELASKDDITTKALNIEDSKLVSQCGPVVDTIVCLNVQPPKSAVDENSELLTKLTVEDEQVEYIVMDTVNSEEMDTHSLVDGSDLIDLDSFIEIDRCSASPTSENSNLSVPDEQIQVDGSILERNEDEDNQAIKMKPNLTETPKGICESPDTDIVNVSTKGIENKRCFHDEGSIDLNFIRPIPKVLSPLKSPVRPKAHLHTLERTAKASAVSILYKDTDNKSTCLSISEELNKENCQPDNKSDFGCKIPEVVSANQLEEGEILSDEEQICKQTIQPISDPSHLVPDQVTSVTTSQSGQDSELQPLSKPDLLILPPEKSATKKVKIDTQPKLSVFPTSKQKKPSADSCLDGILKIVTPSSIQDVLHMLRIIRKHIRKKYMKFKIQFSLTQFHRIIETATLCFITLVRSLDWSCLCSSPEKLQKKLCKHIETKLKKMKINGIVDRIFEQHLIDMKKRLLKFVDEQLDSLFDTLKAVIVKVCDKADVDKHSASSINTQKSYPVKNSQNEKSGHLDKAGEPLSVPCLRRLEFCSQARGSNPKTENDNAVQKEIVKELPGISFNSENVISSSNVSSTSKHPHLSPAKTSVSNEPCPKSQLNSSGLSFNLVSDDHMGDIFKSLIHDSDNLPPNALPESVWQFGTPEKTQVSSQIFDNVDSLSENKAPAKAAFSWSSISPPHMQTFSRLGNVLSPDVFDENCLLEMPTSASSRKTLNNSEDWLKCYPSVLMEDLAVSLTVPSPLKSDSHLSFLRPICNAESMSEVDVTCQEESALDEEDAAEQDLHLTLDSDNSSIGSSEDTGETNSFQYHLSEPMQAVIMEKSNDHFIVKIRRAVSSSSLISDCSSEGTISAAAESLNPVESCKRELKTTLDTKSEAPNHSDLANATENSVIDVERSERVQLMVQENESVFKLPSSTSQHLEVPAEMKLTAADTVEHSAVECESNVTDCIKETCSPVPPSDTLPMNTSKAVDLNLKKRKSVNEKPSSKRQKLLSPPDKDKGAKHNKMKALDIEKSNVKKHRRAVSDGSIHSHSSEVSPTSLSAKNVIKKKGEVVVSWTRDEDRTILLECQKLGPTKKTFLYLSSNMNKYPDQVEERFRQLMKLFKKSRNSSS